ncbi:transglutaminaseTgpA domain-containing protein [Opacimonas viscosa]|uniref:DUF3488 and transglutaminase-like domain-containing protein n=1 Tax=Opacimonas viscosa TaxID=2961944 RepID=A0AA41WW30_9ALTE|nr:DUF3488 and transglutaminase-like domain-containing protein [Opacimonas viscosa]MCP3427639.1 DUF3488 and transglutaminase-like domain-containing protein [Opacimonas viscosa]
MYTPNTFGESIANKPRSAAQNISFLLITLCFTILIATLYEAISIWILLPSVLAVILRFLLYLGLYQHVPSATMLNIIAVLAGGFLIYASTKMALLETMINMLVLASSLKIMVLHTQKDLQAILLSLVFLLGIGFVFHSDLLHLLLYITVLFLLFLTLAAHFAPKQNLAKMNKKVVLICLQALPIALLLFFAIPTLPALWHMPLPKQDTTGLTDTIKPGDIAKLGQSNELAFIATFTEASAVPHYHERYWRSLSVDAFDGVKWFVSNQQKAQQTIVSKTSTLAPKKENVINSSNKSLGKIRKVTYSIQLQKNQSHYAVSLDRPFKVHSEGTQQTFFPTADFAVHSQYPINAVGFYRVESVLHYPLKEHNLDVARYLQLPDNFHAPNAVNDTENLDSTVQHQSTLTKISNPRTQAWVKELSKIHTDRASLIAAFDAYLLAENFRYTLEPELMPNDVIDTFLFDVKSGFCSHYASALGYVLRLAGYPTRLVAGYQGGELLDDNSLSVYQYDAHAWVETYNSEQGWIRLDPTATIAPTRISAGLRDALTQSPAKDTSIFDWDYYSKVGFSQQFSSWLNHLEFGWEKEIARFNQNTDGDLFDDILKKLGINDSITRGFLFLGVMAGIFAIYFYSGLRQKSQPDKVLKQYVKAKKLCLQQYPTLDVQIQKLPPTGFQSWLEGKNTDLAKHMSPITQLIVSHLYMRKSHEEHKAHIGHNELRLHVQALQQYLKQHRH